MCSTDMGCIISHLAVMERRRNFVVRAEQSEALEELFRMKTDKFVYDKGAYTIHFVNPTTAKTIQAWSGCTEVEALTKRRPKEEEPLPIPEPLTQRMDNIYDSILQAQREYDALIAHGDVIDTVLKTTGINEEVLQPRQTRALKIFRRKMQEQEEARHAREKAEEEERRNEEERNYRRKVKQAEETRLAREEERKKKEEVRRTENTERKIKNKDVFDDIM